MMNGSSGCCCSGSKGAGPTGGVSDQMAAFMGEIMKAAFDQNNDGKLQMSELPDQLKQMPLMQGADADNNGELSDAEFRTMLNNALNASNNTAQAADSAQSASDEGQSGSCGDAAGPAEESSSTEQQSEADSECGSSDAAESAQTQEASSNDNASCCCGSGSDSASMFERLLLSLFDSNGDGVLSLDELPEQLRNRLAQFDADGNGKLESGEMASASEDLMNAPGQQEQSAAA